MRIDVDLVGTRHLINALQRRGNLASRIAAGALHEAGERIMTRAKRNTPVDTGALRSSGRVHGATRGLRGSEVLLTFGGPAAPYAVFVHEDLEARHIVGDAKFLETAVKEAAPSFGLEVGSRMARRLEAGR